VKKQILREDLYFRLSVLTIAVPPLRERGDDILHLCHHFSGKFAEEAGKPCPRFTDKALRVLKKYSWPGNVRELENLTQRLIVMTDGDIVDVPDLPSLMRFTAARNGSLTRTLAEVEAEYIKNVLASLEGNKTRAAEILGIDRKTLRMKLRQISTD
jgi:DNA-binding NtrC family response regulator